MNSKLLGGEVRQPKVGKIKNVKPPTSPLFLIVNYDFPMITHVSVQYWSWVHHETAVNEHEPSLAVSSQVSHYWP